MDDFTILKVIGRGSYAKVLMVELKSTKQIYAMKVIKKALVMDEEVMGSYEYSAQNTIAGLCPFPISKLSPCMSTHQCTCITQVMTCAVTCFIMFLQKIVVSEHIA